MSPAFVKTSNHHLNGTSCTFSKSFLVNASNSLFAVAFKVFQASKVNAVNPFCKKSPQKERSNKVRNSTGQKSEECGGKRPRPNPRTPKLLFSQYWRSPTSCWNQQSYLFPSNKATAVIIAKRKISLLQNTTPTAANKTAAKEWTCAEWPSKRRKRPTWRSADSWQNPLHRVRTGGVGVSSSSYLCINMYTCLLFGLRLIRDTLYYRPSACSICAPLVTLWRAFQNYINF